MKLTSLKTFLLMLLLVLTPFVYANNIISDTAITTKIKSKIAVDHSLSVFKVNVNTSEGIVTLSGKVNSDTDASALIELAQSTDGVKDVNTTHLKLKRSKHPLNDLAITAKVKGMYMREKLFSNRDIAAMKVHVETNNNIVYLSGNVDNTLEAQNAVRLAKHVSGVKRVESRISIAE